MCRRRAVSREKRDGGGFEKEQPWTTEEQGDKREGHV